MSEEAQKDESAAKRPGNQNMLLIIIIAVLVTILVAGGIGAMLMMKGGSHKEEEATAESSESHEEEEKPAKAKGGDKEKGGKGEKGEKTPAIYNALEPPFVVNFESGQQARFLQVSVQLMTRDAHTSQQMKDNEPIIRNDLLFLLSSQTYETVSTASGKEELRKKALDTVRAVVKQEGGKPDLVEQVFFTSFVMQ
jgi:flagellar protein FliL